jgi:hypothetical protein
MRGSALIDFDSKPEFARWVCEHAGIRLALDQRQCWRVDAQALTVSLWLDRRVLYILRVHDGWPSAPARKALALAEVFATAVTGELRNRYSGPELARWKARALVESGLVDRPLVDLKPLPPDAPTAVATTWSVIESLLVARRVLGEERASPVPLVTPFLLRWSRGIVDDVTDATLRAGKRWLEDRRPLERAGTAPGRFGRPTQLWRVAEVGFAGDERGDGRSRC